MRLVLALLAAAGAAGAVEGDARGERDSARAHARTLLSTYVFVAHGSGVVVSREGLVLTNNHVIDGEVAADGSIEVRFPVLDPDHPRKDQVRRAILLGTDPIGDIALLDIDGEVSDYAELAPGDALRAGMPVIAVGNPFGLGEADNVPSLSAGVLSTVRIVREDYTDALQLDAPVNPGNSGGPAFDELGRVIGINGQIRTLSGMRINSGVGLAICSTQLSAFLPVLRAAKGGFVHHTAAPKGLTLAQRDDGVEVVAAGDSPLQPGDRLLVIADREVASQTSAVGLFESAPFQPGVTLPVRVRRGDAVLDLIVTCARKTIPGKPYHGIAVAVGKDGRVFIEHVDDESPAQQAGVQEGDELTAVGDRAIAKKLDWLKAVSKLEIGDRLAMTLKRGEAEIAAEMPLGVRR